MGIYEWPTLHSSEHCLYITPGWVNSKLKLFRRLGTASHFTKADGKENEWRTSLDVTKKFVVRPIGTTLQSEVSIRKGAPCVAPFGFCSIYSSVSLEPHLIVQYHWYAVTGSVYLVGVSGLCLYKIINLGTQRAKTIIQELINTLLSVNSILKSCEDSVSICLQARIRPSLIKITTNKERMKPLYVGISKLAIGS